MRRIFQWLTYGLLAIMGGFVSGIGVTLALGLPWLPVHSYLLNMAGIFMVITGIFTVLASSEIVHPAKLAPSEESNCPIGKEP